MTFSRAQVVSARRRSLTMAMNRIQFQHGMSLPESLRRFGTEQRCAEAVMAERWPEGFRCPGCAARLTA